MNARPRVYNLPGVTPKAGSAACRPIVVIPAEVLTAIDTNQLPGHGPRRQKVAKSCGNVVRIDATLQRRCGALAGKIFATLMLVCQCGARPDGIDPDGWSQRLGCGLGPGPKR